MKKIVITAFIVAFSIGLVVLGYQVFKSNKVSTIGQVDTSFNMFSPNDKIEVLSFDDPAVKGVTCYISIPEKGGWSGAVGLSEDSSRASIACRQVAKEVKVIKKLVASEDVFSKNLSPVFKSLKVTRMLDEKRNVLLYLTSSRDGLGGTPNNSITAVPLDIK